MPQVRPRVPGTKKMGEAQRSLFAELVSSPAMTQTATELLDGAFLTQEKLQNLGRPRGAPQIPPLRSRISC